MQNRMKTHPLTPKQIENLLFKAKVGRFATVSPDGFPYIVPTHFVYHNGKIYTHGLPKGQKIDYMIQNSKVGFEIDEMLDLIYGDMEDPCDTNTKYNSVILLGHAKVLTNLSDKRTVLNCIVDKYTPCFSGKELPERMVQNTAVIEISIMECTGKYYK